MRSFLIGIFSSLSSWWGLGLIAAIGSIFGAAVTFLFGIAVLGTALAVIQLIRTTRLRRTPRGRRVA